MLITLPAFMQLNIMCFQVEDEVDEIANAEFEALENKMSGQDSKPSS